MFETSSRSIGLANSQDDRKRYENELRFSSYQAFEGAEGLPKHLVHFKNDLGRKTEVRRPHNLGTYPRDAVILTECGANPFNVLGPARIVERKVWEVYGKRGRNSLVPCLDTAQLIETERQGQADEAQMRLAASVTIITLEEAEKQLFAHEVAIRELRRVIVMIKSDIRMVA